MAIDEIAPTMRSKSPSHLFRDIPTCLRHTIHPHCQGRIGKGLVVLKIKIETTELDETHTETLVSAFSKETFDFFYVEHCVHVGRFIARRIQFDADDILNETFLIAWRKWKSIPKEVANQRLWLYGTARRVIANKLRWKSRLNKFNYSMERIQYHALGSIELDGMNLAVHEALSSISSDHREILMFVEWDGISIREAALILEIPETTVTKRLHAARHTFAIAFKKMEPTAK